MLENLAELMDDSRDCGLGTAIGANAVLSCKMKEGRLNWGIPHKDQFFLYSPVTTKRAI